MKNQDRAKAEMGELRGKISDLSNQVKKLKDSEAYLNRKVSNMKRSESNSYSTGFRLSKDGGFGKASGKPWVDINNPETDPSADLKVKGHSQSGSRMLHPPNPITPDIFPVKPYRPAMFSPSKTKRQVSVEARSDDSMFSRFMQSTSSDFKRILIDDETASADGFCDPTSLKSVLVGRPMP